MSSSISFVFNSAPSKQSYSKWTELEAAEPSTKKSRFNWSEMDYSNGEHTFAEFTTGHKNAQASTTDEDSSLYYQQRRSDCLVCSMVPYGAVCNNCERVQTSKAIALATPPAATWPAFTDLSNWEGTKAPEEALLQDLDMELFEQLNVPHEVDERGRRVYNDCGHRILYYQDSDGNTVLGYEAWYPCSVIGDYEEPVDWRASRPIDDVAADEDTTLPDYDDKQTVYTGYELWYPNSETSDIPTLDIEQRRFAEFLAAQDNELPQFASDRDRIAAWIASSSVIEDEDDDVSVVGHETTDMVTQWYIDFEGSESVSGSKVGGFSETDGASEKWYDALSICT